MNHSETAAGQQRAGNVRSSPKHEPVDGEGLADDAEGEQFRADVPSRSEGGTQLCEGL